MKKRILSLLLLTALAASLLLQPAQAAPAAVRFSDLGDSSSIQAAETLRLMGVMSGYADGTFRPNAQLTRAQFCKMVVCVLNAEDELGLYRTATVYPDVKPSHWAAAYINMAAKGKRVISGYADGKFYPDRTVTVGQAATILLRVLGYKDENIGGVWPDSYLSFAASIGLTDGLGSTQGGAPLTRGAAAVLFTNLLRADCASGGSESGGKGGGSFLSSLGLTLEEDVVLVSSTAKGPDGRETAMRLSNGKVYQMAGDLASNGSLNGCKGTLVLDGQKVRTFLPDAKGRRVTAAVSKVEAAQLTDRSGSVYPVAADATVYFNGEESSWSKARPWLNTGASVTLYLGEHGNVEYIFVGGGDVSSEAVVVYKQGSTDGFNALTGGASGLTIYKNGSRASSKDLRPYDVATYSAATNTIRVCDTRLTGYYEACSPSPKEPESITVMGHEFPVLTSAQASLAGFRPGSQITLLLTEDNQVAGAVQPGTASASGNALGIVKSVGGTAEVELLCGVTVSGPVSGIGSLDAGLMPGQLVRVVAGEKNAIGLSRLSGGAAGALDLDRRRMGASSLAESVTVLAYRDGALQSVSLESLGGGTIPSSRVTYARLNWADKVDLIVLDGVGYTSLVYGRAEVVWGEGETVTSGSENKPTTSQKVGYRITVSSDLGSFGPFMLPPSSTVRTGDYAAVSRVAGNDGYAQNLRKLDALGDVPNSAWTGQSALTVGGRTYSVPGTVLCYNKDSGTWISLDDAHAYANTCRPYADGSGVIRVIEVGSR